MAYLQHIFLKKILFPVFLVILLGSCSSKETSAELQSGQPSYKKIAEERYKQDYNVLFNKDSTYLIVRYRPQNVTKRLLVPLKFFVYNSRTKKIIFQDNLANGEVEWKNNNQLKVTTEPEVIKGKENGNSEMFGYTYDVVSERKLTGQDLNK